MTTQAEPTHLDVYDRSKRQAFAARFDVTEEKLRKAVRMVGSRITILRSHLAR